MKKKKPSMSHNLLHDIPNNSTNPKTDRGKKHLAYTVRKGGGWGWVVGMTAVNDSFLGYSTNQGNGWFWLVFDQTDFFLFFLYFIVNYEHGWTCMAVIWRSTVAARLGMA